MFVCPELIEETGRFREQIFGISGQSYLELYEGTK